MNKQVQVLMDLLEAEGYRLTTARQVIAETIVEEYRKIFTTILLQNLIKILK